VNGILAKTHPFVSFLIEASALRQADWIKKPFKLAGRVMLYPFWA
jgi:hypothetical protein